MVQLAVMPRKKRQPAAADRHKPRRMLGVRGALAAKLQELADRNSSDFTEEGNRAIREMLTREGLWQAGGQKE